MIFAYSYQPKAYKAGPWIKFCSSSSLKQKSRGEDNSSAGDKLFLS